MKQEINPVNVPRTVSWNLRSSISSGNIAHCSQPSHLFFTTIRMVFLASYIYATSEYYDTDFACQVIYKPWVLSVSSEPLVPITAILIPAADRVLLLHQIATRTVTVHLIKLFLKAPITLNVSQTGCGVASQMRFEPGSGSLVRRAG